MSGWGGEGGGGQTNPQTGFPPRSRKQSFLLVTLGTHLQKKKQGFLKFFYERWEQSNRCFDIHRFFRFIFLPGSVFFFQQTRPNFFPGGTGNRNFLATSYPPTYLPTYPPLPPPLPLSSYQTEKKEGVGGRAAPTRAGRGVHLCGPGRRTPSHYFSTRTAAAAASRNT
jgi:hypothetical protein